jgi:hypothetical protein
LPVSEDPKVGHASFSAIPESSSSLNYHTRLGLGRKWIARFRELR